MNNDGEKTVNIKEIMWPLGSKVTSDTVTDLLKVCAKQISQSGEIFALDLSKVETCDSSGVALCIELLRVARTLNKQIIFCNPPLKMMDMIRVSGVDAILPLKNI